MNGRFARSDRVVTPTHGTGIVETAFGGVDAKRRTYSVAVDGLKNALVFAEHELRAEATVPAGVTVRCADCANQVRSVYALSTVRCSYFKQLRSANAPRACKVFVPATMEVNS